MDRVEAKLWEMVFEHPRVATERIRSLCAMRDVKLKIVPYDEISN